MRLGIQTKWAMWSAAAVGTALAAASLVSVNLVTREMAASASKEAESVAALLAEFILEPMLDLENPDTAADADLAFGRAIETVRQQQGVRYAAIYKSDGDILNSWPDYKIGQNLASLLAPGSEDELAFALGAREMDLVHSRKPILLPIADGKGKELGYVRIGYSFSERRAAVRNFALKLVLVSLAGLALGVAICMVLARSFAKPILGLTGLAQKVAKGEFETNAVAEAKRTDEIGTLAIAFNEMTQFLRRGQFLRHAFERYVSADLADRIDRDPFALTAGLGDRREVTILFLDIRGFTKMSEKMSAEDVVKFLVNFFNRVSDPVFQLEGAIDKFIGDAMLSVFGFPITHGDDPYRAVAAAIRIQEVVRGYNRERQAWGLEPVNVGIGINTGMVVAGNVGCERKLDYTVIGDAVNVASRLVGLAKPEQILISASTFERTRRRVVATSLGEQQVKGREQSVLVYEVQGLSEEERPDAATVRA